MLFSKFIAFVCPDQHDPSEKYEEALEQAQLADDLGFYGLCLSESHFSSKTKLPNFPGEICITPRPLLFGMRVIENARNIRIGTAVRHSLFHNPLQVAEEALAFDLLSKGRLDLGVGFGYCPWESKEPHEDPQEAKSRFLEALEILDKSLRDGTIQFKGKYFDIPKVTLVPKPYYSRPRVPIYLLTEDIEMVRLAAEKDYGVISFSNTPQTYLSNLYDEYCQTALPLGHSVSRQRFPLLRQIYIHENPAVVEEYMKRNLPHYQAALGDSCPPMDELKNHYILGTPSDCIEQIQQLQDEMGCQHVILWFNFGWLTHQEVTEQMLLFAREVMPAFSESVKTKARRTFAWIR